MRRSASRLPKTSSRIRNPRVAPPREAIILERATPGREARHVCFPAREAVYGVGIVESVEQPHPVVLVELHALVAVVRELPHQRGRLGLEHRPRPRREALEERGVKSASISSILAASDALLLASLRSASSRPSSVLAFSILWSASFHSPPRCSRVSRSLPALSSAAATLSVTATYAASSKPRADISRRKSPAFSSALPASRRASSSAASTSGRDARRRSSSAARPLDSSSRAFSCLFARWSSGS